MSIFDKFKRKHLWFMYKTCELEPSYTCPFHFYQQNVVKIYVTILNCIQSGSSTRDIWCQPPKTFFELSFSVIFFFLSTHVDDELLRSIRVYCNYFDRYLQKTSTCQNNKWPLGDQYNLSPAKKNKLHTLSFSCDYKPGNPVMNSVGE